MSPEEERNIVIELLKAYPFLDEEIRLNIESAKDIEEVYYNSGTAINFDGMPHAKYNTKNPVELAATHIPNDIRETYKRYRSDAQKCQAVKTRLISHVSHLNSREKNVIICHYFKRNTWEVTAKNLSYSERQCRNIKDIAINQLVKPIMHDSVLMSFSRQRNIAHN